MTSIDLATCWVPVPLRWRHVIAGDVFIGKDGLPWKLTRREPSQGGLLAVQAVHIEDPVNGYVDPDDVIPVLVPTPERDAVELSIDQLGARLVERRTAPAPPT